MNRSLTTLSLCLLGMTLVPAAHAQATKSAVDVAASTGAPEFRDPKSGMVWTPENVGQGGKPILPEDHAFDPTSQNVPVQGVLQRATARPVGTVPISAQPTVPIVNIELAQLRATPGQRWQVVTYLSNNSNNPVDPVVECRFTNGANLVTHTRAAVSRIGPGVRAGIAVMGPRVNYHVDKATCQVTSP